MQLRYQRHFIEILFLLILFIAVVVTKFRFLENDFYCNHDIGGIIYNARVINEGELPYVDTCEVKYPGSFFLIAGVFQLLGENIFAYNAFFLVWVFLTALFVYLSARKLFADQLVAKLVPLFFIGIHAYPLISGNCGNYTTWMTLPIVMSFYFLLHYSDKKKLLFLLLASFLGGLGFMVKRVGFVGYPLVVAAIFLWETSSSLSKKVARALLAFVAFSLPWLFLVLFYYDSFEKFGVLIEALLGWGGAYLGVTFQSIPLHVLLHRMFMLHFYYIPFWLWGLFLATVFVYWKTKTKDKNHTITLLFLLLHYIAFMFSMRLYDHYVIPLLPFFALSVFFLWQHSGWRYKKEVVVGGVLLLLLQHYSFNMFRGESQADITTEEDYALVTAMLQENMKDDETIFVIDEGGGQEFYLFADKFSPSSIYKILGCVYLNSQFRDGAVVEEGLDQLLADLEENPPVYIIARKGYRERELSRVYSWIEEQYTFEQETFYQYVYRLKSR